MSLSGKGFGADGGCWAPRDPLSDPSRSAMSYAEGCQGLPRKNCRRGHGAIKKRHFSFISAPDPVWVQRHAAPPLALRAQLKDGKVQMRRIR